MSTEDDPQSRDATRALRSSTRLEAPTEAVESRAEPQAHLVEVEELIRGVLAAPTQSVDREFVALVRGATKTHRNFQISLALRALRLEQGLRSAQQQVIRLQWELAQLRSDGTASRSLATEAED